MKFAPFYRIMIYDDRCMKKVNLSVLDVIGREKGALIKRLFHNVFAFS